jgi:hypothetical protein
MSVGRVPLGARTENSLRLLGRMEGLKSWYQYRELRKGVGVARQIDESRSIHDAVNDYGVEAWIRGVLRGPSGSATIGAVTNGY